eukprot:COSAG05_NODE_3163_length_2276_cov_1.106569_3_plen_373_part_00
MHSSNSDRGLVQLTLVAYRFALCAPQGFAVCAEIATGIIFGALAGAMSTLMMSMNADSVEVADNLRKLKIWLDHQSLPAEQQTRIMDFFHSKWMSNRQVDYRALVAEMPPQMASEVVTKLYSRFFTGNPLFRGLSSEIIAALCHEVQPMMVVKEQCIIVEGTPGREMFFLMTGEVEMSANGTRLGFLAEGAFFGELAVLSHSSNAEKRVRTVRAVTKCELCFLTRGSLNTLRARYPELNARIIRFARAGVRMNRKERAKVSQLLRSIKHSSSATAAVAAMASGTAESVKPGLGLETLQRRLAVMQQSGELSEEEAQALEDCVGELCVSGSNPGQIEHELLQLSIGLTSDDIFGSQLRRRGVVMRAVAAVRTE